MAELKVVDIENESISPLMFGGNFLFHRDTLGEDGPYEEAAEALGFTSVRYPGGGVTEDFFDLGDPDKDKVFDPKIDGDRDLVPLSEFLEYANTYDKAVQIVLPTRHELSDNVDDNGDRFTNIDAVELRNFVIDVVTGEYGDANITAFEIGNEYWGSGEMSAIEYGRVASETSRIVSEALDEIKSKHPEADKIDIVVQAGTNYNYSRLNEKYDHLENGEDVINAIESDYGVDLDNGTLHNSGVVDWIHVNEQLIQSEIGEELDDGTITGVVTHLYSREPAVEGSGENPLRWLDDHWLKEFPELNVFVSEWNQKGVTDDLDVDDYGLLQATEMLDLIESMHSYSVDAAHVWPTIQWTDNALIRGFDFKELAPGGEMFEMMSSQLIGTRAIKFQSSEDGEHEALVSDGKVEVHGFAAEEKLVMFFTSNSPEAETAEVDLSGLLGSYESVSGIQLGVEPGDYPGNIKATPEREILEEEDLIEGTELTATLGPHEILQVVITKPDWTAEMEDFLSGAAVDPDEGDSEPLPGNTNDGNDTPEIPNVPVNDDPEPPATEGADEDDSGLGDMMWLLALPLLGLLAGLGGGF